MSKTTEISQEDFTNLLDWLAENPEEAAKKYETIRQGLIKNFIVLKHPDAENLADQVFNRVCRKLPEISATYQGNKENYFFGVARNIHLEARKKERTSELQTNISAPQKEESSIHYQCLENCLNQLPNNDRNLILAYYENEKSAKINERKQIAERLNITMDNLRIKIFRLRDQLKKCILDCTRK